MSRFFPNGILIQGSACQGSVPVIPPFQGIGSHPAWPLEKGLSARVDEIVSLCDSYFLRFTASGKLALHVLPDLQLALKYFRLCFETKLAPRTLLCFTFEHYPCIVGSQELEAESQLLGYDFASRSCDFSLIYEDLFGEAISELPFRHDLNEFGLFPDIEILTEYMSKRREAEAKYPGCLEQDSESCVFKLFDCTRYFIAKFSNTCD